MPIDYQFSLFNHKQSLHPSVNNNHAHQRYAWGVLHQNEIIIAPHQHQEKLRNLQDYSNKRVKHIESFWHSFQSIDDCSVDVFDIDVIFFQLRWKARTLVTNEVDGKVRKLA